MRSFPRKPVSLNIHLTFTSQVVLSASKSCLTLALPIQHCSTTHVRLDRFLEEPLQNSLSKNRPFIWIDRRSQVQTTSLHNRLHSPRNKPRFTALRVKRIFMPDCRVKTLPPGIRQGATPISEKRTMSTVAHRLRLDVLRSVK